MPELATTEPRADLRKPRPRAPPWAESDLNGRPKGPKSASRKYAPSSSATSPSATRLSPPSLRTGEARRWSIFGAAGVPQWRRTLERDTMVLVNSTTKGLAAMTIAVATSRGWIDYDARVAEYWPEFAQNGKAAITVRQLLSHEAGLVWIDEPLHFEDLRDLDYVARALAKQKPAWEPGTRHGYHAMTIGSTCRN